MRVLISNDDGIAAAGIWAIAQEVANRGHQTIVVCPARQQSGMSHALTVGRPLEVKKIDREDKIETWSIDGTPTDCVKIYLESMCDWHLQREHSQKFNREIPYKYERDPMPDAVISGINHGPNLATDVLYSGTVGAALEGYLHELPSLAVSLETNSKLTYETAAKIAVDFFEDSLKKSTTPFFYNMNLPRELKDDQPEIKFTRLGRRDYVNAFKKITDETGRTFFQIQGESYDTDEAEGTDLYAVHRGFISVTPLQVDLSDYKKI